MSKSESAAVPRREKSKVLPTNRIAVPKQVEILRAYAAAAETQGGAVTNADVGKMVGMTANTVSLANAFFTATGLLERNNGGYVPAPAVREFFLAHAWNPETAAHKLAPIIGNGSQWYYAPVMTKARFRQTSEDEIIADLALAAEAGPEYKTNLRMILEYMELAGVIIRDNGKVMVAPPAAADTEPQAAPVPASATPEDARRPAPASAGVRPGVSFAISVHVDMDEIAMWSADRISAFFAGIAQVQAARGGDMKEKPTM